MREVQNNGRDSFKRKESGQREGGDRRMSVEKTRNTKESGRKEGRNAIQEQKYLEKEKGYSRLGGGGGSGRR